MKKIIKIILIILALLLLAWFVPIIPRQETADVITLCYQYNKKTDTFNGCHGQAISKTYFRSLRYLYYERQMSMISWEYRQVSSTGNLKCPENHIFVIDNNCVHEIIEE